MQQKFNDYTKGDMNTVFTGIKHKSAFDTKDKHSSKITIRSKKFGRRIIDCGNPRYAASKASTVAGALLGGKIKKVNLKDNIKSELEKSFEPKEKERSQSPRLLEELGSDKKDQENISQRSIEEITYIGDEEYEFFKNQRSRSPKDEEEATAFTNLMDNLTNFKSGVPTTYVSQKCHELNDKLSKEQLQRQKLEQEISKLRDKLEENSKQLEMCLSNNQASKLMVTDQRNMMQSSQNYALFHNPNRAL